MGINSYIAKQFSRPEGPGGRLVSTVMNRQNRPLYDETIRHLALCDADSVLDIGCGNGYVLNLLAQAHGASFAGIDPAAGILKAAARRCRRFVAVGKMHFSCQDVGALSFADGAFTKAYSINTVYFWDKLDRPMQEIGRVLKPGGVFLNTLYTNQALARLSHTQFGYRRYTAQQLENAGAKAGFQVRAIPFLQGAAVCYIYKKE
ncbi:class I SAM-dependent methyltransferase [Ruminococcaceae bacterium OttesenSCG-928-O06]|nr:class I SAM-dependent methyltransferase [Ruminococcaceae bacterium OttesenSCG-928-O06]